jgi:hypothetical protein
MSAAAVTVVTVRRSAATAIGNAPGLGLDDAAQRLQSAYRGLTSRRRLGALLSSKSVDGAVRARAARLRDHARGFGALARFLAFACTFFGALSLQRSAGAGFALERPLRSVLGGVVYQPTASAAGYGGAGLGQGGASSADSSAATASAGGGSGSGAAGGTGAGGTLASVVTAADVWDWVAAAYRTLYDGSAGGECEACTAHWARCTICAKRCYSGGGAPIPTAEVVRATAAAAGSFEARNRTADAIAADPARCGNSGECANTCDMCLSAKCAGRYARPAWHASGGCKGCEPCFTHCLACFPNSTASSFQSGVASCATCEACKGCMTPAFARCHALTAGLKAVATLGGGHAGSWGAVGTASLDSATADASRRLPLGALQPAKWVDTPAVLSAADPSSSHKHFLARGATPACRRAAAAPTREYVNRATQGQSSTASSSPYGAFQLVSKQLLVMLVQERRAFAGYCPWAFDFGSSSDPVKAAGFAAVQKGLLREARGLANASDAALPIESSCFGTDAPAQSGAGARFVLHPTANRSGEVPGGLDLLRFDSSVGGYALAFDTGTFDLGVDFGTCALEGARDSVHWLDKRTKSLSFRVVVGNRERRGMFSLAQVRFEFEAAGGHVTTSLTASSFPVFDYYAIAPPAVYGGGNGGGGASFEAELRLRVALEVLFVALLAWYIAGALLRALRCLARHFSPRRRRRSGGGGGGGDGGGPAGAAATAGETAWALADLGSYGIFVALIAQWAQIAHSAAALGIPIDMDVGSPAGYASAVRAFSAFTALSARYDAYLGTSALAAALLLVRFFGALQFHRRISILVDTLCAAAEDLAHFFLIFGAVLGAFSAIGTVLYGGVLPQFRTLADSMQTLAGMVFADANGVDYAAMHEAVPGLLTPLFFWAFVALAVLLLLNLLLAIVVDAFVAVKSRVDGGDGDGGEYDSFAESLLLYCHCRANLALRALRALRGGTPQSALLSPLPLGGDLTAAMATPVAKGRDAEQGMGAKQRPVVGVLAKLAVLRKATGRHRAPFIELGMSPARASATLAALLRRHHATERCSGSGAAATSETAAAAAAAVAAAAAAAAGKHAELHTHLATIESKLDALMGARKPNDE